MGKITEEKISWLKKAYKHYLSERFNDAIFAYNQVLQIDKTNARAHFGRALAFYRLNKFEFALSSLKLTLRYNPNHIRACIIAGDIYCKQGLYKRAIVAYNLALRIDPADKDALLGKEQAENCQIELDKKNHELSKDFSPDDVGKSKNVQVYELILGGDNYYRAKKYEDALEAYTQALQCEPDNRNALLGKARTYFELKQYKEARDIYGILQPRQVVGKMWYYH